MESVFIANPNVDVLFVFGDGNCFVKESDAIQYKKLTKMLYKIAHKENAAEVVPVVEKEEQPKVKKPKK